MVLKGTTKGVPFGVISGPNGDDKDKFPFTTYSVPFGVNSQMADADVVGALNSLLGVAGETTEPSPANTVDEGGLVTNKLSK